MKPETLFNAEAEQQLLGSLLLDASRISAMPTQDADIFFDPAHSAVFKEIRRRYKMDQPADPVAMKVWAQGCEHLEGFGGARYLVRMAGASVSSTQVKHYCDILDDLRAKREIAKAIAMAQEALTGDTESAGVISGRLEAALASGGSRSDAGPVSMTKAVTGALTEINDVYQGREIPGVKSGLGSLDAFFGKMSPGQLILLAGRPSMGKAAVALSMALNVARSGKGVCMATLEMTPESMSLRALSEATANISGASTPYADMLNSIEENQMRAIVGASKDLSELPIQFLPPTYRDVGALYSGAKRCQSIFNGNLGLVVIDYLQLLNADGRSRTEQVTNISIAMKALAMQLGVPVLALSQLSRAVETRDNKRPMLSDLRESGQLEQDADAVLFCYRGEYYLERDEPEEDDLDNRAAWMEAMEQAQGRLEIIVAKQRQGRVGTAKMRFNPALNLIWDDVQ